MQGPVPFTRFLVRRRRVCPLPGERASKAAVPLTIRLRTFAMVRAVDRFPNEKSDLAEDFRERVERLIPTAFSGRARWNADMVHFHLGFAFALA